MAHEEGSKFKTVNFVIQSSFFSYQLCGSGSKKLQNSDPNLILIH